MASVQLEQVSKCFAGTVQAVRGLSLAVEDGELLALVGASGCGKTTLLRMIAGLESPDEGEIQIGSRRVNELDPAKRNVAMMFQSDALFPHLTVRQNLAFGLKLQQTPRWRRWLPGGLTQPTTPATQGDTAQRIIQTAQRLQLDDLLDRRPGELSGGQRRRVSLGAALVVEPEVLLLDEPLANLDAQLRLAMRSQLKQLQQQLGLTMILVTHDQAEAMTLGHRIAVMESGRLLQTGAPLDVYHQPATRQVASHLGSPRLNLLVGQAVEELGVWWFVNGDWKVKLTGEDSPQLTIPSAVRGGKTVEIGVRPEDIRLQAASTGVVASGSTVHSLAKIFMVEALGDSAILYLQRFTNQEEIPTDPTSQSIQVKLSGQSHWQPEDRVSVRFTRCIWFCPETGQRVIES